MIGVGIFGGVGASAGISQSDGPLTSGVGVSDYAEMDGGWGPAFLLGAALDKCKVPGASGAPYSKKVPGAGSGFGFGAGKSASGTFVFPSFQKLNSMVGSWFGR